MCIRDRHTVQLTRILCTVCPEHILERVTQGRLWWYHDARFRMFLAVSSTLAWNTCASMRMPSSCVTVLPSASNLRVQVGTMSARMDSANSRQNLCTVDVTSARCSSSSLGFFGSFSSSFKSGASPHISGLVMICVRVPRCGRCRVLRCASLRTCCIRLGHECRVELQTPAESTIRHQQFGMLDPCVELADKLNTCLLYT